MTSIRLKLAGATALLLIAGFLVFVLCSVLLLEPYYVARTEQQFALVLDSMRAVPPDVRSLDEAAKRLGAASSYRIETVDINGQVISSSAPEFHGGDRSPLPREELESFTAHRPLLDQGKVVTGVVRATEGGQTVVELAAMLAQGNYLVVSQPLDRLRQSVRIASAFFFAVAVAMLLLEVAVAFVAAGSLTGPIIGLTAIAQRIAALDFSQRWGVKRNDELGILGSSVDTMAGELARTIAALSAANEAVRGEMERQRAFLGAVAHEFKTPAGLVRGYAEALKLGLFSSDTERGELADVIIREAEHLDRLVQDLMTIVSPDGGRLRIAAKTMDLARTAAGAAARFSIAAQAKEVRIVLEAPDSAIIVADEDRVIEILDNYLSNALRHAKPDGFIAVRILETGAAVRIEVGNQGEAIPDGQLGRVFEPFYRTDASRSRDKGGAGLGLAVVKAIVEAHGGGCGASNTDQGPLFWAELPKGGPAVQTG
jgi:signal transduction histidine kinase